MTLTQKALRDWSQFPSVCGSIQGYFGKTLTESFLFDTDAQALSQAYLHGLTVLFQSTRCEILRRYDNRDTFRRLWSIIEQWSTQLSDIIQTHDSHHLDNSTVWTVLDELHELVYTLLLGGIPEIYRGPHMLIASQLYLKVIQSHHPNLRRLRFRLEVLLVQYHEEEDVNERPLTDFYSLTNTSHDTIMDCFRRTIALVQDSTIAFEDRLHIHSFVLIVTRSTPNYGRIFLANRALYWLCTSMACFPDLLAADPYKYGKKVLFVGLKYIANLLYLSGPEYISEALDADILNTVLQLDRLFPWLSNAFADILDALHMRLIFRGVERRARKALNKTEKHSLDADLKPGATRDAWLTMKSCAQHVHAYKSYYHSSNYDNELQCNNSQCPNDSVEQHWHPKRCTSCWITLYCSRACQKLDWKGHREECHKWAQQRKDGTPGPVGDHDYFYIRRYVIEELKTNGRHIRDLKREYLKTHPDIPIRRLVIECDYNNLPWTFRIISLKDIEERVAEVMPPELFDRSDRGKSQLVRLSVPWKGGPENMVVHVFYTPHYPSDEHLLIRGL